MQSEAAEIDDAALDAGGDATLELGSCAVLEPGAGGGAALEPGAGGGAAWRDAMCQVLVAGRRWFYPSPSDKRVESQMGLLIVVGWEKLTGFILTQRSI